jgi:hypothetical protein
MNATTTHRRARSAPAFNYAAIAGAALGCGALAARPALLAVAARPAAMLGLLFAGLLIFALVAPLPDDVARPARQTTTSTAAVTALGVAAFALGRIAVGGHAPTKLTLGVVLANTLAAVAEEAWFRRLCFGLLAPAGPVFAVAGSTLLFAAVHVSIYGFWILPLDLAAGALLGWQRAVTGSWAAPAITHVIANLLVLM